MDVSVVTTCYNSSEYIEETINAVLNQNIDFDFEYIVSDDGSTDNSVEIIKNIMAKHPKGHYIKLIEHPENIGVVRNFFGAVNECQGDLIALCDSDDVWQDQNKLKIQYDFMKNDPSSVLTYHKSYLVLSEDLSRANYENEKNETGKEYLTPHTSTVMFRNNKIEIPWKLVKKMTRMNDQLLRFMLKYYGKFTPIEEIIANKRIVRPNSVFESNPDVLKKRRSTLYNWLLIYKYYKRDRSKNKELRKKVIGFKSKINWLHVSISNGRNGRIMKIINAVIFDVKSGQACHSLFKKLNYVTKPPKYLVTKFYK